MTEPPPRALPDHEGRSRTTIHGWPAVFLGLPFLAAGIAIALVAGGVIPMGDGRFHAPRWVIGVMGAVFAFCGASMSLHGAAGLRRLARARRLRSLHPDQPWISDHPWERRGSRDDTLRRASQRLVASGVFAAFLIPFNGWAFGSEAGGLFVIAAVLLFDAVTLLVFGHALYLFARRAKYGRSYVRFDRFPFFVGDELSVWLKRPPRLEGNALTATLRCVEERYGQHDSGGRRRQAAVSYELHEESKQIDISSHSRDLAISFPLPADGPTTRLAQRPPRYWELTLRAEQPGVDYSATFLLPVYARPGRR